MSSFGAGGGSATQTTGGQNKLLQGLGLDQIMQQLGQSINPQNAQHPAAVQPGQMAQYSPQQRLAMIMQQYAQR